MPTNHEHKYTAESLLQAIEHATFQPHLTVSSHDREWILKHARELDAARPKPAHTDDEIERILAQLDETWHIAAIKLRAYIAAHTDVAAKMAEALRPTRCFCSSDKRYAAYTCVRCSALAAYDALCVAQAQREGAQGNG